MSELEKKVTLKPIKTFRHGAIAASVWKRQAPSGFEYLDFSLSRSWKAKASGKEGYSPNFFVRNSADLIMVIQEVSCWIASQEESMEASLQGSNQTRLQDEINDNVYDSY